MNTLWGDTARLIAIMLYNDFSLYLSKLTNGQIIYLNDMISIAI
jgi:hypothetical protein